MDKLKKEVGNKKHNVRRAFIIATIVIAAAAVGVGAFAALSASPVLIAIEGAILAAGLGVGVGAGVAINKAHESVSVASSKKTASKSLKEIERLNKDKTSTYTKEYRAKVIRKYAKANLVLTRKLGATIYGVFHSNSGLTSETATGLAHQIDAYTLLEDVAPSNAQQKKYARKRKLAESKLSKLEGADGVRSAPYKWTKSYDDVLPEVSVYDRRTEISCLTETARASYEGMFESDTTPSDNKILNILVHFNNACGIKPTYARAEDQTKEEEITKLLLKDVIDACASKTSAEVKAMFPIAIESKVINKKSTKILSDTAVTYNSLTELKEKMDPSRTA